MGALVGGLDRIRGVPHRPWVRGKLVALVIALATSVLVVATTLALIGGSRLVDSLAEEIFGKGAPNVAGRFLYLIGTASLLLFTAGGVPRGPQRAPPPPCRVRAGGAGGGRPVARRHAPLRPLHRELRRVPHRLRRARRRGDLPDLPLPDLRLAADRRRGQRADLLDAGRRGAAATTRPWWPRVLSAGRPGTSRWCGWPRPGRASGWPSRSGGRACRAARRPRCARGSRGARPARARCGWARRRAPPGEQARRLGPERGGLVLR